MRRDFAPVTLLASQPSVLAVHPSVNVQNVRELVALAKAQPGKLAYGSAGVGSATHLGSELFRVSAQLDLLHVPYKSAGLATAAAISGEVQMLLTNMASALPHVKTGRLRGLGVTSSKRSLLAPEMPTVAEAGVPGFEYATWYGMVVPAATPANLVAHMHAETVAVLTTPAMRERMQGRGLEVHGTSQQEFGKYLSAELSRWQRIVKAAGIQSQ
jgi:tripartite-type tricarboxylate transporter receptor subunit TctC